MRELDRHTQNVSSRRLYLSADQKKGKGKIITVVAASETEVPEPRVYQSARRMVNPDLDFSNIILKAFQ